MAEHHVQKRGLPMTFGERNAEDPGGLLGDEQICFPGMATYTAREHAKKRKTKGRRTEC